VEVLKCGWPGVSKGEGLYSKLSARGALSRTERGAEMVDLTNWSYFQGGVQDIMT